VAPKRSPSRKAKGPSPRDRLRAARGWARRWGGRLAVALAALLLSWIVGTRWVNPPATPYILSEGARLGSVERDWVPLEAIAPVMARAAVAAEDADFCLHWGFDVDAIRSAIEAGASRGASTITQQTVKNVFLWQGRSWPRKALEAAITPLVELTWPKRRILEVYLNVAEFDEGVFGVEAAARRYFGVGASALTARQAAALASILPAPRERDAARLSPALERKARRVADGAATIRADGRAACFED
jgi:monofunctional biosynthetic peptidoglycan transglycosylase